MQLFSVSRRDHKETGCAHRAGYNHRMKENGGLEAGLGYTARLFKAQKSVLKNHKEIYSKRLSLPLRSDVSI